MKETFLKLKELWNNKRYRAILWLIIYIIFFAIVFSLMGNHDKMPKKIDSLESFRDSNYTYTINNEIEVGDNKITYQSETYEASFFPQYNFNITPKEIYTLIKSGKLESQNFIDNSYTYLVTADEYNKILENKITSTSDIHITTYKKEDTITRVVIDFSEFYGYDYVMDLEVK